MRKKYKKKNQFNILLLLYAIVIISFLYYGYQQKSSLFMGIGTCLIIIPTVLKQCTKKIRTQHYLNSDIRKIDKMDGHDFEKYLAALFSKEGYQTNIVGKNGHDFGGDIVITRAGKSCCVQAKRSKSHIGVSAVQEAISGMAYYHTDSAMVITNSYFTV